MAQQLLASGVDQGEKPQASGNMSGVVDAGRFSHSSPGLTDPSDQATHFMLEYLIQRRQAVPDFFSGFDSPDWTDVPALAIDQFHSRSHGLRPLAWAKLLYTSTAIHVFYQVTESNVLANATKLNDPVWRDSCVELFLKPKADDTRYFNVEMSCNGVLLASCVTDPTPTPDGPQGRVLITPEQAESVIIRTSFPRHQPIPVELAHRTIWQLGLTLPLALLEAFFGPLGDPAGQVWRANLYKCCEANSTPHWASWSPIGDQLNFHQPDRFAAIRFAGVSVDPQGGTP